MKFHYRSGLAIAGALLVLAGSILWGVPWVYFHIPKWTPCYIPLSLAEEFSVRTNFYINTPGRYFIQLKAERAAITGLRGFELDDVNTPEHLDCQLHILVLHKGQPLLDTNVVRMFGGILGRNYKWYTLAVFDIDRSGELNMSVQNHLRVKELASVPCALEVELTPLMYKDRLVLAQVGRTVGAPFVILGVLMLAAHFVRSLTDRNRTRHP